MKFSIQSFWKSDRWHRVGKVEKAFAVALAGYLILLVVWPDSALEAVVALATFVLGCWIGLRFLRIGLRKITWRLRNRLVVAYLFIAVLPILLVLTLVGLGGYMLAGQVAVYLVRSELDRRVASLASAAEDLSSPPTLQQRFPGVMVWVAQNGAKRVWPPDAQVDLPAGLPTNSSGIASRDGRYYAWADVAAGNKQVLALEPLSREYLSAMISGLGDVYFLQPELLHDNDSSPHTAERRQKITITRNAPKQFTSVTTGDQKFTLSPAGGDTAHAAVPSAVNRFDLDVQWGSLIRAMDWADVHKSGFSLLLVHTRLSALFATILSRGGDELQGGVLAIFYGVAIAFLMVGIAGLALGISISRNITGAVHALYQGTQRVMHGDFSHLIQVSGRDQLAELSSSFNTMTQNLERLLVVSKEKERLQTEIEIARGVQDQLYPKAPPVFETLQVLGKCDPARMVSGDYYDYQLLDGKLALALGDVAGKGISAALLMATIQAALRMELRACAEMPGPSMNGQRFSTARIVSVLNQQLHATTSPEKYATFFFAIYDPATNLLTYTNAGHLQPVLIRGGSSRSLDVSGLMVGAFPFAKYEESKVELCSGDLLVCYTDGITEPENEYGEMFGEERLIEIIAKNADREEAQIIESVMESVRQWTGTPELFDDMTVLLARKR